MIKVSDLKRTAQERLTDAEALLKCRRHDAAVYICGYAVEIALKARICKTLHWPEYSIGKGFESFKTHNLEVLLQLSGRERVVKSKAIDHWSTVTAWKPETRYGPAGEVTDESARKMISAARAIMGVLR